MTKIQSNILEDAAKSLVINTEDFKNNDSTTNLENEDTKYPDMMGSALAAVQNKSQIMELMFDENTEREQFQTYEDKSPTIKSPKIMGA